MADTVIVTDFDGLVVVRYREMYPDGWGPFGLASAFRLYAGENLTSSDLEIKKIAVVDEIGYEVFRVESDDLRYEYDDEDQMPFAAWLAEIRAPWWAIVPIIEWIDYSVPD